MSVTPVRRESSRGFTLIEVIVALSILSVAVVASIQGFAQGLRLLKLAGDHQRATLFADQKLREVVVPHEGEEREDDREAGFTWERVTTVVETPDLVPEGERTAPWKVWNITVRVRWDERRQVELATLRTTAVTETGEAVATPAGGSPTGTSTSGGARGTPRSSTGLPSGTSQPPPGIPARPGVPTRRGP